MTSYSPPARGSFIRRVKELRDRSRAAEIAAGLRAAPDRDAAFRARVATAFARAAASDRAGITCPPETVASGDAVRHPCGAIASGTAGACWHCGGPVETETTGKGGT